jgi:hypothetical protein
MRLPMEEAEIGGTEWVNWQQRNRFTACNLTLSRRSEVLPSGAVACSFRARSIDQIPFAATQPIKANQGHLR